MKIKIEKKCHEINSNYSSNEKTILKFKVLSIFYTILQKLLSIPILKCDFFFKTNYFFTLIYSYLNSCLSPIHVTIKLFELVEI